MSEEEASAALYKDGEIVWVKLGPSWWPGEAKDIGSLPEDVATFKKPPLVVVKFFDEDLYEYIRSWSNIHPYNCEKKNEFIRKGLAAYRAKAPHMEKFPKDVSTAEAKIDGNPNILSDPEFMPKKKFNLNDLFQKQIPRMKRSKDKHKNKSTTYAKDTAHITHRRFLGTDSLNDYRAYICIQYPGKDRTSGDPEDDEVIRINTEPEQDYKCYTCAFTTKRLEVMIMHRKSHIQGVYVSTTPRKYKSPLMKRQKKDRPKVKGPEAKKKKVQTSEIVPRSQSPLDEAKTKESKELTSELLAEWDDDEEERGENFDQTVQCKVMPYSPCKAAVKGDSWGTSALQLCGSQIDSPVDSKKGQKKDPVSKHSTVGVERTEQNDAKEYAQKKVDYETTDTNGHKQEEQTNQMEIIKNTDSESTELNAILPEKEEITAHEKKSERSFRWDSRILEKRKSKSSEKKVSKECENSEEGLINVEDKELKTYTKREPKSSEKVSKSSTIKDSGKKTTSQLKTSRRRDSKSPEMKKSSRYEKNDSKRFETKVNRSVEEGGNISAADYKIHSKYDKKSANKKETKSTDKESRKKKLKTSNDNDTKCSATDTKATLRKDSKTPERKDSKCNERESKSSQRGKSRSIGEKRSATDSKTLWKKDENSGKNESRTSNKESKSFCIQNSETTEDKEARSYGVDLKSPWRRKTPENESKTKERRNIDQYPKNADLDPQTILELDSGNSGLGSFEEIKTSWRRDSKSCDETSYKSLWKRDSRGLNKKDGKDSKALGSHESKNPESQVDKDIKSCFDFDEEEEEELLIGTAPAGRKIPRVIPERRKSITVDTIDIPNTSGVSKDSHSLESNTETSENFADVNLENTFKELMEITKVPNLPDIKNTLKCEQNFHDIKTIKFPDKALGEPLPPKEEVATKLTNPKKRFVKSFEDFEMMQNNIKKKEEEIELHGKMQQKVGLVENKVDKSLQETVDFEVNETKKEEEKVYSTEDFYIGIETSKEPNDVQRCTQKETSHHIEPPAQLNKEKTQQLVEHMMKLPPILIEKQYVEENVVIEGNTQKYAVKKSSEKKVEIADQTIPPQPLSGDNNEINNELKVSKLVVENFRIVKPKAKLITPFKIQSDTNKQHSTISMKDVITNMTKETEPPVDLETKVHFANLKSKIMSKIIEDSKLSTASKNKIMSLMESEKDSETEHQDKLEATQTMSCKRCHKTPRTKILESYMEDQKKAHTSDSVFQQQNSSMAPTEEEPSLSEEAIPVVQKRIAVLEEMIPVIQERKGIRSMRGSHPKKDRTSIKETESLPEKSHISLPQEEAPPTFMSEEPSKPLLQELPWPDHSAGVLPDEPQKPIIQDGSQCIVLDEIPLPEDISVEDIPLPPEPQAHEPVRLDSISLPSTEEVERSEQPPLSCTQNVTQVLLAVERNKTEELQEIVSQDTTKPLTIHLDNDNSESIFTSQSFLSSSMDFSPIGMASASLPENAICLPPKKSKKRKHSFTDDEADSGSSKKASIDSQQFLDDVINWDTMNNADSATNVSEKDNIDQSSADKASINSDYSAEADVNWTTYKQTIVKRPQASTKEKANWSTKEKIVEQSQSRGEGEVSGATTENVVEDSQSFVEDSTNWTTSEQLATGLHHYLASDEVNWSNSQKIAVENAERWENEQQSITSEGQDTFENRNDGNEQSFQEAIKEGEQNLMIEKLVENGKPVMEEDTVQEGIEKIIVADKAEQPEKAEKIAVAVRAERGDKLNTEILGKMSSLTGVEDREQMPVIDAVADEKPTATEVVERKIEQDLTDKDLEEIVHGNIPIMTVEEEKNENVQEEFDDNNVEEVIIDVGESDVPSDRKDEKEHVDSDVQNITIMDHQNEKVEQWNEDNVGTVSKEQHLQSNLMRGNNCEISAMKESLIEEPVIEKKTVVKDMTAELIIEKITKDRTLELGIAETLPLGKQRERLQELDQAPSKSILTKKSMSTNQKSPPVNRNNEENGEEHSNEVEIHCVSNSDDDIKFSIQTNLSNFSSQQEISAIALATLADIKTYPEKSDIKISTETSLSKSKEVSDIDPNVMKNSDSSFAIETSISKSNDGGDIGLEKVQQLPEMVHIEGNLTVMSEKDLADGQVEITPEQVISTQKSAMLSNFSMDFSDSTNDSCNTNEPNDFDSKGTEFTSNAMTKEIKQKCTKRGNTYGRLELLNILEGNPDNEKKEKPKPTVIGDDMCDFEDHIPSQIVCAKNLTNDMLNDNAPKTSISVTTHKLLERLSESKNKLTTKADLKTKSIPIMSKAKSMPKVKSNTSGKSVTLPELVVESTAEYTTKDLDDIEDVKAFVIHKDLKKFKAEEPEAKPVPEKPAGRGSSKRSMASKAAKAKLAAGKAKILQQTIITPAGEIIQPNVTLQQNSIIQQKSSTTIVVTQPKHPPQPTLTIQAKSVMQPIVKPTTAPVTHHDDNVFDINSMPIVLSDELLTPECIEKMPIMIGTDAALVANPVTQENIFISTAGSRRPIVRKIIGKMTTTTTPSMISQPASTTTSKTAVKPRIVSGNPPKVLKQVTAAMANHPKSGKYIIVPQSATVPPTAKYVEKKPPLNKNATTTIPTALSPEPIANKIMIVTNQQGQQQRLLLTPAQQKLLGCQTPATKVTKTIVKGNVLQKGVPAATGSTAPGTSEVLKNQSATIIAPKFVMGTNFTTNVTTATQKGGTQVKSKGSAKRVQQINQKLRSPISKSQKTILIKTSQAQAVRKIQGTDRELEKQVAEQLEAIRASSGKFAAQQQVAKTPEPKPSPQKPSRRSNATIPDSKTEGLASQLTKRETAAASPPAMQLAKREVGSAAISETKEVQTQPSRPLNQLVIQDAMGNQTTITEGQILALPSETVDGQPQSYMLVTLDESGNLTPLNNEALMSLDPNLGLTGDLSNMVLQIDQGGVQTCSGSVVERKLRLTQQAVVKSQLPVNAKTELLPAPEPEPIPESEAKSEIVEPIVEQKAVLTDTTVEGIAAPTSATEPSSQQLIVTGDPIATQKFLESLSEGTTDLANILANADGNSILIQADGQQILINTTSENQMLFGVGDSNEGGRNPIFCTQPGKNQDILAAALADTDVFQSEQQGKIASQLSPNDALYPMNVGNVLETSLTLSSPIMTPLEVPSTNNKKIPDDEADILTRIPQNVDLPITVTDPNISQAVANQQVASLLANELQSSLELSLPIPEACISTVPNEINSPSYPYSLPTLEDSVDISTHKPFNSSMPLLNEDVDEAMRTPNDKEDTKVEDKSEMKADNADSMDSKKQEDSINSDGSFLEEEGRFTLGGEMCSSLSEPPPEMFDIPEVNTNFGKRLRNNITSINSSPKDSDLMDISHADSSNDGSCEIPLQPMIIAKSTELNSHFGQLKRNSDDRERGGTGKRNEYD